jgi:hypothetical protein
LQAALDIMVVPARSALRPSFVGAPLALVFVLDPAAAAHADADLLTRLFGLTAAEALVVNRLVGGSSIEDISADRQVSR